MSDPFTEARDAIFSNDDMTRAMTYSAGGTVRAFVSQDLTRWGDTISISGGSAVLSVSTGQVAERPLRGSTFTDGSTTWLVEQVLPQSNRYVHYCLVVQQ